MIGFTHRSGEIDFQDIRSMHFVREGPELTVWEDDSGRQHFFDKDGYYDGWGEAMARPGEAKQVSVGEAAMTKTFEESFSEYGQFQDSESFFQNPTDEPESKFFARWGWHARDAEIADLQDQLTALSQREAEVLKLFEELAMRMGKFQGDSYGNYNGPSRQQWAEELLAAVARAKGGSREDV